jgi:CheY-like chemotaxis protein
MKTFLKPMAVRWMIVDDNPDILLMMSAVLENLTSATIECHDSPQSALAAFAAAPDSYQLVITDFEMPGMNGIELCRQIRALAPAQKVFLATGSGYFTEISAARAGFAALLNKPFPVAILKATLEKTFGRDLMPADAAPVTA